MVDTDPQGTLTRWWEARQAETPKMAKAEVTELQGLLRSLKDASFRLAIIDTAGRSSEANRAIIDTANFVLMPVKPSAADLWALGATVEVCRSLDRPFAFAVCQATRNAAMTVQAVAALASHGPVAPIVIHNRVSYAAAMGSGLTLQEIEPKGPGADEIAGLWAFVQARLPDTEQSGSRARKQKATVNA
jgi:chromosome partitioning protein